MNSRCQDNPNIVFVLDTARDSNIFQAEKAAITPFARTLPIGFHDRVVDDFQVQGVAIGADLARLHGSVVPDAHVDVCAQQLGLKVPGVEGAKHLAEEHVSHHTHISRPGLPTVNQRSSGVIRNSFCIVKLVLRIRLFTQTVTISVVSIHRQVTVATCGASGIFTKQVQVSAIQFVVLGRELAVQENRRAHCCLPQPERPRLGADLVQAANIAVLKQGEVEANVAEVTTFAMHHVLGEVEHFFEIWLFWLRLQHGGFDSFYEGGHSLFESFRELRLSPLLAAAGLAVAFKQNLLFGIDLSLLLTANIGPFVANRERRVRLRITGAVTEHFRVSRPIASAKQGDSWRRRQWRYVIW